MTADAVVALAAGDSRRTAGAAQLDWTVRAGEHVGAPRARTEPGRRRAAAVSCADRDPSSGAATVVGETPEEACRFATQGVDRTRRAGPRPERAAGAVGVHIRPLGPTGTLRRSRSGSVRPRRPARGGCWRGRRGRARGADARHLLRGRAGADLRALCSRAARDPGRAGRRARPAGRELLLDALAQAVAPARPWRPSPRPTTSAPPATRDREGRRSRPAGRDGRGRGRGDRSPPPRHYETTRYTWKTSA